MAKIFLAKFLWKYRVQVLRRFYMNNGAREEFAIMVGRFSSYDDTTIAWHDAKNNLMGYSPSENPFWPEENPGNNDLAVWCNHMNEHGGIRLLLVVDKPLRDPKKRAHPFCVTSGVEAITAV